MSAPVFCEKSSQGRRARAKREYSEGTPGRVTTAQGMPAAAIGCNKSMSPMTQASAWCGCALAVRLVADACRGDAFGCVSAPTVARRRETNFQIDGVCLTKRLSRRRAADVALTGQPRQVAAAL